MASSEGSSAVASTGSAGETGDTSGEAGTSTDGTSTADTTGGNAAGFEGLGDLRGGEFYSQALDVSADGSVIVGAGVSGRGVGDGEHALQAVRWVDGRIESLGAPPGGALYSEALAVSADGSTIVGTVATAAGREAFRWSAADGMQLLDVGGSAFDGEAYGVSADGSVIVGSRIATDADEALGVACRWVDGAMEDLGFPADASSNAFGVSADGSVIVGEFDSGGVLEAFRWEDGVAVGLGTLYPDDLGSHAHAVTPDGSVIVGVSYKFDTYEAFRWEDGAMSALGDLPGGALQSQALAVSADGSIVVGNGTEASGDAAFIWTEATGMQSLKALLEEDYGLDLGAWHLQRATGITHDATAIVGLDEAVERDPDSSYQAWRAFGL